MNKYSLCQELDNWSNHHRSIIQDHSAPSVTPFGGSCSFIAKFASMLLRQVRFKDGANVLNALLYGSLIHGWTFPASYDYLLSFTWNSVNDKIEPTWAWGIYIAIWGPLNRQGITVLCKFQIDETRIGMNCMCYKTKVHQSD